MAEVATVILPLPVKSDFDYRVPEHLTGKLEAGMRVLVTFGRRKIYTALVRKVYELKDEDQLRALKWLDDALDEEPVVLEHQIRMFDWMAWYYFCTPGDVFRAALPSGMKPESSMRVEPREGIDHLVEGLKDHEFHLMDLLRVKPSASLKEVMELWNVPDPASRLRRMEQKGLIRLVHRVVEEYKPKTEKYLRLQPEFHGEDALQMAFDSFRNAPKQEEIMMLIVSEFYRGKDLSRNEINARVDKPYSSLKSLIDKGILAEYEIEVDRLASIKHEENKKVIQYNEEQALAYNKIKDSFLNDPGKPVLLHGVTGSGKTHLYIDLIKEQLAEGKQVLYLLPEIGLTKQIIDKVKSEFGDEVGIYHSRFSDNERVEIWQKVLSGEYRVVVGVRSAIFLPFKDLGLIVVDEEHDHSFKQVEPAPRYHARDVAVYYPRIKPCQVLLGSATPAFESYYNAREGKFELVEITKRATDYDLPEIRLVDMREQRKRKLNTEWFSSDLIEAIRETVDRGEQVILFQNRRGFAPYLICSDCGTAPRCMNCDITLTYHKRADILKCHYCGFTESQTKKCQHCGNYNLRLMGVGTEKLEEQLREIFPDISVERMDFDTTRTKDAFANIISRFEKQEVKVLVGTQMVSKGLDFANVTLVSVVEADHLLNFPDFRAWEHAYQVLTQVSGRAGRSTKKGRVIIQTSNPEHFVLRNIQGDFRFFYESEVAERLNLNYPPFSRMIRMEVRHKDFRFLDAEAQALADMLKPVFGNYMLGPEYPPVSRLRGYYRKFFMFKLPKKFSVIKVREHLYKIIDRYYQDASNKSMRILVDVDPV